MITLEKVVQQVEDYLDNTDVARQLCERDRAYKNNKQWTDAEEAKLLSRNQAPITVNRIKPKVEGLKGLLISRKTDPKALPRTPKHEESAEAVTDALRFVDDNVDMDQVELDVADEVFVEGTGAAIIEFENGEVTTNWIPWDRYYYDIHSRRLDFKDKKYDGIILWLDVDDVRIMFGLSEKEAEELLTEQDSFEEFEDRVKWVDTKNRRVRVAQHYVMDEGVWNICYFVESRFLIEPAHVRYVNEENEPVNPIEAVSANIDEDNNRFGEVRFWIHLQDEINHRRSKFLHLLSVRQTSGRKGAIPDIPALKRELSKPDGHVEYDGEKGEFEVLTTGDMAQGQFTLMQDGKAELDAVGFNAQLSGERQGDLSGRAISNLQQAATNELSSLYTGLSNWKKRVYTQHWLRIRQFWNEERWIRVTDDTSKLRWVGFNQPITVQQSLEETINDDSLDLPLRQQAAAMFQQMMQNEDPGLNEITEVRNPLPELDMDINIETTLDTPNIQQEQFELMANIAQGRSEIPFTSLLRLSNLRDKDQIIKDIETQQQAAGQAQQQKDAIDLASEQSKANKNDASTEKMGEEAKKIEQEAIQTSVETQLLLERPPDEAEVTI